MTIYDLLIFEEDNNNNAGTRTNGIAIAMAWMSIESLRAQRARSTLEAGCFLIIGG